eukprot:825116-Alexandrium_andersonii.AAC.1
MLWRAFERNAKRVNTRLANNAPNAGAVLKRVEAKPPTICKEAAVGFAWAAAASDGWPGSP